MPICPLCDDTGLLNSDSTNPNFCYCSAGKKAQRQWNNNQPGGFQNINLSRPPSFIDVSNLEQVNASVDAMRASLFGLSAPEAPASSTKPSAVQLLQQVAHPGHEISMGEAAQLHDLAKALEGFLGDIALIGRKKG